MRRPVVLELSDFDSVVACAETIRALDTPIDALVCNAGVLLTDLQQVRGLEMQFVVNHLGHFLLANRLLDRVTAAPQGRVVVVGSGPNGLVAANHLADRGWSVLVLEAQPDVGGAVRSAEDVHPGFVHDTFSAFYPLGAASPAIRDLRLEEHGLRWRHAPAVLGHPLPDQGWALLHRNREVTAELMDSAYAGDG